MKVYIAAPFFNFEQTEQVLAVENLLEKHAVEYFSPRSFGVIKDMSEIEKQLRMEDIYNKNVEEIINCDTMIVLVDHKDTGTTWELGFASGRNKSYEGMAEIYKHKIITVSFDKKPINVMLRYCIDAHATTERELEEMICSLISGKSLNVFKNTPEVNE